MYFNVFSQYHKILSNWVEKSAPRMRRFNLTQLVNRFQSKVSEPFFLYQIRTASLFYIKLNSQVYFYFNIQIIKNLTCDYTHIYKMKHMFGEKALLNI